MKKTVYLLFFLCIALLSSSSMIKPQIHYYDRVAVLMYHDFDLAGNRYSMSAARFEEQLRQLKKQNFRFISMKEFLSYKQNKARIPVNAVLLTFDDGYEDFYTKAYPILKKNKIPAVNFIVVNSTDTGNPGGFPHLTWDQMREMKKNRMEFYSHTNNQHYQIPGRGPATVNRLPLGPGGREETDEEYRKRMSSDLELANQRLEEELGRQPKLFAYPYGYYNDELDDLSRGAGNQLQFMTTPGLNGRSGDHVFRINAGLQSIKGADLVKSILTYTTKTQKEPSR